MVCPFCGSKTAVINSRRQRRNNNVWRRRRCLKCRALFTTQETMDLASVYSVKSPRGKEPFLIDKLFTEVLLALQDRKNCYLEAREITSTAVGRLLTEVTNPIDSTEISKVTGGVLKRFNRRAWLRYAAEHPSIKA